MKTCFGYVRISDPKQDKGVSLPEQKAAIEDYAKRNELTISDWFIERRTAAKSGRPVFNHMIRELKAGKADGMIMHKVDRSARNPRDWVTIGELSDAGIDIHFVTESLDFRSRGGRLTADIQAVIAADYIRNLREEAIKGLNGRLKQGLYPFKAPIGYLDNGGGNAKTPDPLRAPLIRQAFELYASGHHSIRSLLIELEHRGLRNERGKPITKGCLENLLANPFYCGVIRIKRSGAVFEGVHKPLVSVDLFEDVQDRKAGRTVQKKTKHRFTYRSLLQCQHCSRAMIAERQKGHVYYRCHTKECPTKTVREELVDTSVWQTLRDSKLAEIDVATLTRRFLTWSENRSDKHEALAINNEIGAVQGKIDRLTDALIDRLIDQETFAERKDALVLEKTRLGERLQKATERSLRPQNVQNFLELAKSLAATYLIAEPDEKREIVEIATSNRHVIGKSVYLEPSNWLRDLSSAIIGLSGPPDHTTDRTELHASGVCCEKLCELIEVCPFETERLERPSSKYQTGVRC